MSRGQLSPRDALTLGELGELQARILSQTESIERLANGIVNHVLFAGTIQLPPAVNGVSSWSFQFGSTCGSVEISVPGTNVVTVAASTPSGDVPTVGTGIHKVQDGTWRLLNIGQRFFTVYGTAADFVGVQAFTTGGVYGGGVA